MALAANDWERVSKFLAGEMSEAEKSAFEQWRKSSPENELTFREGLQIWNNSTIKLKMADETDSEWKRLESAINKGKSGIRFLPPQQWWLSIAASIVLIAAVIYFIAKPDKTPEPIADITVSSTGQVITFTLPDSSVVWLNKNSSISYPKDFDQNNRNVTLKGEAFFQVKRKNKTTFIVSTGNTTTTVLGTSFNLKEQGTDVILSVAEGLVRFGTSEEDHKLVNARQMATFDESGNIKVEKIQTETLTSWRKDNNPQFELEMTQPLKFLSNSNSWRKNTINQTVVEGTIENSASLASYKNISLKLSYTRGNGKVVVVKHKVAGIVTPGQNIQYKRKLNDILNATQKVEVEIVSAEPEPNLNLHYEKP